MKLKSILFLFLIFQGMSSIWAQSKKTENDTIVVHRVEYDNGKISAYSWLLKSTQEGRAICYDPSGTVMFLSSIRRKWGHHSVEFHHHSNKVVSKIIESSAPDAGIQWYRTTYTFDEKGKLTGKMEDGHDRRGTVIPTDYQPKRFPGDTVGQEKEKIEPVQEVQECAVIYSNEAWFINSTPFRLEITTNSRGQIKKALVEKGDTVLLHNAIQAQFFDDPMKGASFEARALNKKRKAKGVKMEYTFHHYRNKNSSHRNYYYQIKAVLKDD